jgi:Family of unknown function (DUF6185)
VAGVFGIALVACLVPTLVRGHLGASPAGAGRKNTSDTAPCGAVTGDIRFSARVGLDPDGGLHVDETTTISVPASTPLVRLALAGEHREPSASERRALSCTLGMDVFASPTVRITNGTAAISFFSSDSVGDHFGDVTDGWSTHLTLDDLEVRFDLPRRPDYLAALSDSTTTTVAVSTEGLEIVRASRTPTSKSTDLVTWSGDPPFLSITNISVPNRSHIAAFFRTTTGERVQSLSSPVGMLAVMVLALLMVRRREALLGWLPTIGAAFSLVLLAWLAVRGIRTDPEESVAREVILVSPAAAFLAFSQTKVQRAACVLALFVPISYAVLAIGHQGSDSVPPAWRYGALTGLFALVIVAFLLGVRELAHGAVAPETTAKYRRISALSVIIIGCAGAIGAALSELGSSTLAGQDLLSRMRLAQGALIARTAFYPYAITTLILGLAIVAALVRQLRAVADERALAMSPSAKALLVALVSVAAFRGPDFVGWVFAPLGIVVAATLLWLITRRRAIDNVDTLLRSDNPQVTFGAGSAVSALQAEMLERSTELIEIRRKRRSAYDDWPKLIDHAELDKKITALDADERRARRGTGAAGSRRIPEGLSVERLAFLPGATGSWLGNGLDALRVGAALATLPVAYYVLTSLNHIGGRQLDQTVALVVVGGLAEIARWLVTAFAFGAFYPYLPGRNGPTRGLSLAVVIAIALAVVSGAQHLAVPHSANPWGFTVWEFAVYLVVLGVLVDARVVLRQHRNWRLLLSFYNVDGVRSAVGYALPLSIALVGLGAQLINGVSGGDVLRSVTDALSKAIS